MENSTELLEINGFITYYKFHNEETNYSIALFKIDDNSQERTITIVGYFPHFEKEDGLIIKGTFIRHKKFGLQFQVEEIIRKLPDGKEGIIRFLSSSLFPKVGKMTAQKIYDYLKDDSITALINNPEVYTYLLESEIINEKQYASLREGLKKYDFTNNSIQLLLKHGFSMKNIMKLEATYKDQLDNVIKSNPYQIIDDVDGIGFKTIDKLASNMGIKKDDSRRVKAAILYTLLNYCHNNGDTYIEQILLFSNIRKMIDIDYDIFTSYINDLLNEKRIYKEKDNIFHYSLYLAEYEIANSLKPDIQRHINQEYIDDFDKIIQNIQENEGIKYSEEQIHALKNSLLSGLFIITGGPGTGKTTILNALIKIYKKIYGNEIIISLCAPTGRASKRMNILTDNYACTIHRLLKWDLHSNKFSMNKDNPLHTDIIIIDEFSMVDTLLFAALLNGVCGVSQIILIGDDGQIPSVGAGSLLHDFLQVEAINNYKLTKIFRQSEGSGIIELAHDLRYQEIDRNYHFKEDVKFINIKNVEAAGYIISCIKEALNQGYNIDDIQVIIPMYANVAGIDNINRAIQDFFNPQENEKPQIAFAHQVFRIGDRVLQLKNQPEDDIFNGDVGCIIDIDEKEKEILVDFDGKEVEYNYAQLINLTLGYAISVHKSQGSEFPIVIMCVFSEYGVMLHKQLIYTAITRAKKLLIILGEYTIFIQKSKLLNKRIRKTTLRNRLLEVL